ncbi:MAG: terminase small subunit [Micropepsaceae bacterium]
MAETALAQLTPQKQRFVTEYLRDLHGKGAAVRAGYAEASAHVAASRLLKRPDVRHAIAEALETRFAITKLEIIEELAAIAFSDIGDYLSWTETELSIFPSSQLTRTQMKAIASVRQRTTAAGPQLEVRFVDKLKALELLARILGLLEQPAQREAPAATARLIIEEFHDTAGANAAKA